MKRRRLAESITPDLSDRGSDRVLDGVMSSRVEDDHSATAGKHSNINYDDSSARNHHGDSDAKRQIKETARTTSLSVDGTSLSVDAALPVPKNTCRWCDQLIYMCNINMTIPSRRIRFIGVLTSLPITHPSRQECLRLYLATRLYNNIFTDIGESVTHRMDNLIPLDQWRFMRVCAVESMMKCWKPVDDSTTVFPKFVKMLVNKTHDLPSEEYHYPWRKYANVCQLACVTQQVPGVSRELCHLQSIGNRFDHLYSLMKKFMDWELHMSSRVIFPSVKEIRLPRSLWEHILRMLEFQAVVCLSLTNRSWRNVYDFSLMKDRSSIIRWISVVNVQSVDCWSDDSYSGQPPFMLTSLNDEKRLMGLIFDDGEMKGEELMIHELQASKKQISSILVKDNIHQAVSAVTNLARRGIRVACIQCKFPAEFPSIGYWEKWSAKWNKPNQRCHMTDLILVDLSDNGLNCIQSSLTLWSKVDMARKLSHNRQVLPTKWVSVFEDEKQLGHKISECYEGSFIGEYLYWSTRLRTGRVESLNRVFSVWIDRVGCMLENGNNVDPKGIVIAIIVPARYWHAYMVFWKKMELSTWETLWKDPLTRRCWIFQLHCDTNIPPNCTDPHLNHDPERHWWKNIDYQNIVKKPKKPKESRSKKERKGKPPKPRMTTNSLAANCVAAAESDPIHGKKTCRELKSLLLGESKVKRKEVKKKVDSVVETRERYAPENDPNKERRSYSHLTQAAKAERDAFQSYFESVHGQGIVKYCIIGDMDSSKGVPQEPILYSMKQYILSFGSIASDDSIAIDDSTTATIDDRSYI